MKLVISLLIAALSFGGFYFHQVSVLGETMIVPQDISIEKGDTLESMLTSLLPNSASKTQIGLYKKFFSPEIQLQVGTYRITQTGSLVEVLQRDFKKPVHTDVTITFLPGWNLYDIVQYLDSKGIASTSDISSALLHSPSKNYPKLAQKYPFLQELPSFEGVMYPDTYRIPQGASIGQVLEIVLLNFDKKIYSKLDTAAKNRFKKTLILASIVEKEERVPEEKFFVAGVLSKRIEIGMSLGADATVCYALELSTADCKPSDIVNGLQNSSKYNTRKFSGLPPGPISNVSRESWLSAQSPKSNGALYYLHDNTGEIHYAATLEEHNRNKRQYLGR